jgi:SAM-dependent methyltransferase
MSSESPLATPLPWDLVSADYDAETVPMFENHARCALQLVAAPRGSRIVDVACGPGTLAGLAARDGHRVEALDFSPKMVARLEQKIAAGLSGITVQIGDGQALPYGDGEFAAGFSMFGLIFFPDRARGFRELRRVLAPGARAAVASWAQLDTVPAFAAVFGALREALPQAAGSPQFPLATSDSCRAEMAASFANVEVHAVPHTTVFPDARALWQHLARTMAPIALVRERVGPERWPELDAKIGDAVVRSLGEATAELTPTALITVGTAA